MRDFAKVSPRFWTGTTGKKLREAGRDVQTIALYLLSCPSANMIGLYYLPLPTLCHEINISLQGASKGLRSLSEAHFAYYDATEEVVWIPEMARFQIDHRLALADNRVIGIARELIQFKKSRFFIDFYAKYQEPFHLNSEKVLAILESPLQATSKPLRSQEQEQEQENKEEELYVQLPAASPPPSSSPSSQYEEPKETGPPRRKMWPAVESFTELYNLNKPPECPTIRDITPARRKKYASYLKQFPAVDFWNTVFLELSSSDFLRGLGESTAEYPAKARDLDWLCQKGKDGIENCQKTYEGKYRPKRTPRDNGLDPSWPEEALDISSLRNLGDL